MISNTIKEFKKCLYNSIKKINNIEGIFFGPVPFFIIIKNRTV